MTKRILGKRFWFSKKIGQSTIFNKLVEMPSQHGFRPSPERRAADFDESRVCAAFAACKPKFLMAPVDKPLDIHSIQCAEPAYFSTDKFLSNNDPN
jgi:hypothetical protein